MAPGPQPTYLDRVVMELIETERTYVRDLRMIVEDYLAHIIETSELCLRPEQVCALFGNIEDIYEFNSELLQALDLCDSDPVAVARCFVLKSEYFEIYTQYCTNYPNSVAALTDCMRNKSLAGFFRERQSSLKRSLPLGSYLLKPVQRILKYHLLLQEIAKHFDRQEDGYEVVEEAIFTMTGVAWYINDMKRKHEHAVRLQEIQSLLWNWTGADLTTYGELVLEGTFRVHRGRKDRTLFLFDRMLLICKRRGEHYVYKTHISCSTLMFIESSKDSLSFSVAHYKQPKKAHTVQARNLEEKKLWAHHIKRIILENHYAIIPQRAKEAILDLDSVHPPRFRYSPDRLKKALPCQAEEIQPVLQRPEGGSLSATRPEELNATKSMLELSSADQKTPEPPTSPEPDASSDPDLLETLKPDGDSEPTEEQSSAAQDSDSKTLSSGESSEDDEKEETGQEGGASSILPSSVLDKASAIAQHFSGSIKRGSLQDGGSSPGFASPRLPSRTGSAVSLCVDVTDRHPRPSSVSSNAAETFGSMDLASLSPRDDSVFDADRGSQRRRDSTLSKHDQLLIGKIRMYYENAGSQDATFGLRRRESLTYIPTGLVQTSVSRFNSVSQDQMSSSSPYPESGPHNPLGSIQPITADREESTQCPESGSDRTCEEEDFRSSSEMVRIWQAMERDLICSPRDPEPQRHPRTISNSNPTLNHYPEDGASDPQGGASDPSNVNSSRPGLKPSVVNRTGSLKESKESLKGFGAPGSQEVQLKVETREARPSLDQNQLETKVLNLARQYSQRIKGTRPMVRQGPALGNRKTLACVVEEESPGKVSRTLPRQPRTQTSTVPQPPAPGLPCRSRGLSPGRPQNPQSGLLPIEVFDWPDVRELRTRYTNPKSPAVRTWSFPEQMGNGGPRRRSTSDQMGDGGPRECSTPDQIGVGGHRRRLHRAASLDPRLSGMQDYQNHGKTYLGHYVAAEAPLPGDPNHNVLVLEKLPVETSGGEDQDYVQIRSPTSREKISIMAVMDRCRVYQEYDKSRGRAELDSTDGEESQKIRGAERAKHRPGERQSDQKGPKQTDGHLQRPAETSEAKPDVCQQSLVKNLREKFQSLN